MQEDQRRASVPPTCQRCGRRLTPIVYGYPSSRLFRAAERGEVLLGGCLVSDDAPLFGCLTCRRGSPQDG